MDQAQ